MLDSSKQQHIDQLLTRIAYQFSDQGLLKQALSHRSVGTPNNERLEFIGDSILNCTIAQALYQQLPKATEGDLSRIRADLVCETTLADIAREWDLGLSLFLGPGEIKNGGAQRPSILSDTVEALIGAISLDADMATAQASVLRWYGSRLASLKVGKPKKDAKTELQEAVQKKQVALPVYHVESIGGADHNQTFKVRCDIPNLLSEVFGEGTSRRKAEQAAAAKALQLLRQK